MTLAKKRKLNLKKAAKLSEQITGVVLGSLSSHTEYNYRFRYQVVLAILKKFRKKKSLVFLIYHALWKARGVKISGEILRTYRFLTGRPENEMRQMYAIYLALEKELGTLAATQCLTEIGRAVSIWEKKKNV